MKVLVINNHTKRLPQIKEMLVSYQTEIVDLKDIKPNIEKKFDLVVLTGGHGARSNTKTKSYDREVDFILNCKKPVFGICMGMQLIARAYKSKIKYMDGERVRGVFYLKLDKKMFGAKSLKVFESHLLTVTDIGEDLEAIARSEFGIEIIKHKNRPVFGVQFHPEADEEYGTSGKLVFDDFISKTFFQILI